MLKSLPLTALLVLGLATLGLAAGWDILDLDFGDGPGKDGGILGSHFGETYGGVPTTNTETVSADYTPIAGGGEGQSRPEAGAGHIKPHSGTKRRCPATRARASSGWP